MPEHRRRYAHVAPTGTITLAVNVRPDGTVNLTEHLLDLILRQLDWTEIVEEQQP